MNRILKQLRAAADQALASGLPEVTAGELEQNGELFYMNSQNGTEFDWYVNGRLSSFMAFYNDEANLGAVKLLLSQDGTAEIYLYGDQGRNFLGRSVITVSAGQEELLELAVLLRREADDKRVWDAGISTLDTDAPVPPEAVEEFRSREPGYAAMRSRRLMLTQTACVSARVTDEGWKVGYMARNEPYNDQDRGGFFASGTEEPGSLDEARHLRLVPVGMVWQQLDPDIFPYLDRPVGTRLIRTASGGFEPDRPDQEIAVLRRETAPGP